MMELVRDGDGWGWRCGCGWDGLGPGKGGLITGGERRFATRRGLHVVGIDMGATW